MGSVFGILIGAVLILNAIWIKRNPDEKILMHGFFVSKPGWGYYLGGGIAIIAFSLLTYIIRV